MQEEDKEKLKTFADVGEEIIIGEDKYMIYPLTLGKVSMLSEPFVKILPVVDDLQSMDPGKTSQITDRLHEVIDEVINAFQILTHPNDGTKPKIDWSKEKREDLEFKLTIGKIIEIFMKLRNMALMDGLLKNVKSPDPEKRPIGASSSEESSE